MSEDEPTISYEKMGEITVIHFRENRITDIEYSRRACNELDALARQFGGRMLLCLDNVEIMSSVGISILVTFNRRLRAVNGQLKIGDVQPLVWDNFRSVGLDKALDLYHTRTEAMSAFVTGK